VRFRPVEFTPTSSNLSGKKVYGIGIEHYNRELFSASRLGIELALALRKLYPGKIDWEVNRRLIGSQAVVAAFAAGSATVDQTLATSETGVSRFMTLRQKYLLYQ